MILTSWTIFNPVKWNAIWKNEAHAWITSSSHESVKKYTVCQLIKEAVDILPLKHFGYPESLKNLEAPKIRSTLLVTWSEDEGGGKEAFCIIHLYNQYHLRFCLSFKLDMLFPSFWIGILKVFPKDLLQGKQHHQQSPQRIHSITFILSSPWLH